MQKKFEYVFTFEYFDFKQKNIYIWLFAKHLFIVLDTDFGIVASDQ